MNRGDSNSNFFVFEGIDGSGKSTQWEMACDFLVKKGYDCTGLREPTDGQWGRKIRRVLKGLDEAGPGEQVRLFILDREDDLRNNIQPVLERGGCVVMDRYYYSNAAYQGAQGIDPGLIIRANREAGFPEPQRVYYIDVDPELALERIAVRNPGGDYEIFEKLSFLVRVRDIFLELADSRFLILDGSASREEISSIILEDIERHLS